MRPRTAAALLLAFGALSLGALADSASAGGRNDTFIGPIEQARGAATMGQWFMALSDRLGPGQA
jgi:hypothetical protein